MYSGFPGSAFGGNLSGNGGSIAGRPGVRGPGREPLGTAPGLWAHGRPAPPASPPGRGVNGRPPCGCCGRMGCPGRGPVGRPLPGTVPGIGPRFPPVGIGGRGGDGGRDEGVVAPAAGRAAIGCEPAGAGRTAGGASLGGLAAIGCPGVATGRGPAVGAAGLGAAGADGAGAAGFVGEATPVGGAPPGAAGLTAGGAGAAVPAGAAGAGFVAAGGGVAGATAGVWAAGGWLGTAGATGLTAAGAGAAGAGATGRFAAALAAASFAAASAASASAVPRMAWRTFSATSTGIELECVFFSVTPKPGSRSMIALALTSSSRASSLMRT